MRDFDLQNELYEFISDMGDDYCGLEVLLFFSRHPAARFNRSAVLHASNAKQFDTGMALKHLIEKNLVVTCIEHGITLYALTGEEPAHSLAVKLAQMDKSQRQNLIEQVINTQNDLTLKSHDSG